MSVNALLAVGSYVLLPRRAPWRPWRARREESAPGEERWKNQSGARDKLRHSWQIIDLSIRNGEGQFVYLPPFQRNPPLMPLLKSSTLPQHTLLAFALSSGSPKFSFAQSLRMQFWQLVCLSRPELSEQFWIRQGGADSIRILNFWWKTRGFTVTANFEGIITFSPEFIFSLSIQQNLLIFAICYFVGYGQTGMSTYFKNVGVILEWTEVDFDSKRLSQLTNSFQTLLDNRPKGQNASKYRHIYVFYLEKTISTFWVHDLW